MFRVVLPVAISLLFCLLFQETIAQTPSATCHIVLYGTFDFKTGLTMPVIDGRLTTKRSCRREGEWYLGKKKNFSKVLGATEETTLILSEKEKRTVYAVDMWFGNEYLGKTEIPEYDIELTDDWDFDEEAL